MYNIEKLVNEAGGSEYIRSLIEDEGFTMKQVLEVLGVNTTSRITYGKFVEFCKATIPFPRVAQQLSRKWMIRWERCDGKYWEDEFLVEETLKKLDSPILNTAGSHSRYVVSMWGHPYASKDSHQVRAHQVVWELDNEGYLPEGYEIEPVDGNFLNLDVANLRIRSILSRKSLNASGSNNYFYTGTPRYTNYSRGWNRISAAYRKSVGMCEMCNSTASLNTHHIISYWLFPETDLRVHNSDNLLCLCDRCHGKVHQSNTSIVPHISEMKYKNLLELLESLKSQVPDQYIEMYTRIEKQLGLTGNQQPSV